MWGGVLFGAGFAALVVALALILGRDRELPLFAVVLGAAAAVYVGAALSVPGGSAGIETAGFVVFAGLAAWGWDRAGILAWGWLAHAAWDLLHLGGALTSPLPEWYEVACLVADPLLAAYLLYRVRSPG